MKEGVMEAMTDFRGWREAELENRLKELLRAIRPLSEEAEREARLRWSRVAKPLGSLGVLEEDITRIVPAKT